MPGPLISAFNAVLSRISEIDKKLNAIEHDRAALLEERGSLLRDLGQARDVLTHLTPVSVDAEVPGEEWPEGLLPSQQPRVRKRPIRSSSSVGFARDVLRTAKRDMHIDELISMIAKMYGRPVSKATLVSNLSRYVRAKDTFTRSGPNVYGLIPDDDQGPGEMLMM